MSNIQRKILRMYIIGFVSSIVLTILAFSLVNLHLATLHHTPTDQILLPALIVLAIVQLLVQLFFFLHLGKEPKPRLNLMAFLFMVLVVGIIVIGSLWIMKNLDYNMSHGPMIEKSIIKDEGIHHEH